MKNTDNYGLNKPEVTDFYNIDDHNANMDIIDAKMKELEDNTESRLEKNIFNMEKAAINQSISDVDTKVSKHTGNENNPHNVTKAQIGLGNVENKSSVTIRSEITGQNVTKALGYTPLNSTLKGANSGLAELDENGKVPTSQLPSYVDDVLEYSSKSAFPATGESGKIYIATDTNLQYRWSGTAYAEISSSLALGETSSTAYRGDRGATAYAHSQKTSGNPHGVTKSDVGLGNVPNVATNDQTPTYSDTTTLATLTSGEKISTAFAKIKLAITNLISHIGNKSNPHGVTASQVGLGNVPNVATNNQTPTYTVASANTALTSGETLSTAFSKIAKAISSLISHLANTNNPHKVTATQISGTLPIANGGTGATTAEEARTNLGVLQSITILSGNINTIKIPTFTASSHHAPYSLAILNMPNPAYGIGILISIDYLYSANNTLYYTHLKTGNSTNTASGSVSWGNSMYTVTFSYSYSDGYIVLTKTASNMGTVPVTIIGNGIIVE